MSQFMPTLKRTLPALGAWAYRSLFLAFFLLALLRLAFGDAGWFNLFVAALALGLPLAVAEVLRRRKARA